MVIFDKDTEWRIECMAAQIGLQLNSGIEPRGIGDGLRTNNTEVCEALKRDYERHNKTKKEA